jgi:hypothetical protein
MAVVAGGAVESRMKGMWRGSLNVLSGSGIPNDGKFCASFLKNMPVASCHVRSLFYGGFMRCDWVKGAFFPLSLFV